jgi:hypothetical protein
VRAVFCFSSVSQTITVFQKDSHRFLLSGAY